jgi:hypothetical protein
MSMTRVLGVVVVIVGVVLIVIGAFASRSLADSVSTTFTGRLTQHTSWYIFGGIATAAFGLLLAIGVIGRGKS